MSRKTRVEECYVIDVAEETSRAWVQLLGTYTVPFFGGRRYWLVCLQCGRRCRKLYVPPNGRMFGCRGCLQLSYLSQKYGPQARRRYRIERLKEKLGATGYDAAVAAPTPPKPKGMRWATYQKLVRQLRDAEGEYWNDMRLWVQRITGREVQ